MMDHLPNTPEDLELAFWQLAVNPQRLPVEINDAIRVPRENAYRAGKLAVASGQSACRRDHVRGVL